jgi:hypothetical protein
MWMVKQVASVSAPRLISVLSALTKRGLISQCTTPVPTETVRLTRAHDSVGRVHFPEAPASIRPRYLAVFLWAWLNALIKLRFASLEEVTLDLAARKAASSKRRRRISDETVRRLVLTFLRLRSWVYTATDSCLVDSLALAYFLIAFGGRPLWIIGVKSKPFLAHCWVQHEHWVLNDTLQHVEDFKPIAFI